MADMNYLHSASAVQASEISIAHTDEENTVTRHIPALSNIHAPSISFVVRLPIDILAAIFIEGSRDYYDRYNSGHHISTAPSWVNVSYVCRHWRHVSLNCPTLWSYLFDTSPHWTQELLSRSKHAPLKAYVDLDFGHKFPFLEQVMTHVERLEEFRFRLPWTTNDQIFSILSLPAPRLRYLTILPSYMSLRSDWPSVLFGGDTPALRTLELTSCLLPWYSLNLSGLTNLDLCRVPLRFHEEFLSTLRRMHGLTHLYLENTLDIASASLSSAASDIVQKIDLPHLARLFVFDGLSTVLAFLSCVNIPSKTEVRLRCYTEYDSSPDDYAQLSSLLTHRFHSSDNEASYDPTIRSLTIKIVWDMATLTFSASEHDCGVSTFEPRMDWGLNVPMQLTVRFNESKTKTKKVDIISDICCCMPLTNVRRVHIVTPPFPSSFWSKTLGHLSDVRYLKLSQGYMPDLAPVLSLVPYVYTENQDRLLAPALEVLELYDITFSSPLDSEGDVPSAADVQSLYDALSSRKECPGHLTMVRCVVGIHDGGEQLDMVGRWGDGRFLVIEECRRPCDSQFESEGSDSDSLFGSH